MPENHNETTAPLPAAIWIYGGGWNNGDKHLDGLYDASNLIKSHSPGHVQISMNYREKSLISFFFENKNTKNSI